MKRGYTSFLSGALTAVLVLALCGTALAVSGNISYNTVNVALEGQRKLAAGAEIAAPNGQRVPSSILYTDEVGGKTNYLPIRAIAELLGVEITYDAATGTVHLGARQPVREGWHWTREWAGPQVRYGYEPPAGETPEYPEPPRWRIAGAPEGWLLDSVSTVGWGNTSCAWRYGKGTDTLSFSCYALYSAKVGARLYVEAAGAYRPAVVRGRAADFYQDGDKGVLFWETADGALCQLDGPLSQAALERIAESVEQAEAEPLPDYQLGWLPEGSEVYDHSALREVVQESWLAADGTIHRWMYTALPAGALRLPEGTPETVRVRGVSARYWPPEDPDDPRGGITVTTGESTHILAGEAQESTLLWTDEETGVTFCIQGVLAGETLRRVAEGITAG